MTSIKKGNWALVAIVAACALAQQTKAEEPFWKFSVVATGPETGLSDPALDVDHGILKVAFRTSGGPGLAVPGVYVQSLPLGSAPRLIAKEDDPMPLQPGYGLTFLRLGFPGFSAPEVSLHQGTVAFLGRS